MDRDYQEFINLGLIFGLLAVLALSLPACSKPEMDAKAFFERQERHRF